MKLNKSFFNGVLFLGIYLLIIFGFFVASHKSFSWDALKRDIDKVFVKKPTSQTKTLLQQSVVEEESATIDVVDTVSPAVVSIIEKTTDFDPYSGPISQESGIGTGFIVDSKGVVITNSHVVFDPEAGYAVVLKDGRSFDVRKIHRDATNDLAILEIAAASENLPAVELGDSSKLKVGQKAIAIGNALGQFSNSVTVGVISGLVRQVTASGSFGESPKTYTGVIQTDAALNPGNSGGPLLNLSGQVVGVNVATTRGADNIGFAIPVNELKPLLESFNTYGKIRRTYLGVVFSIVTKDLAELRRFPEGAYITRVAADSPAEVADIQRGDTITAIDDKAINEDNPLDKVLQQNYKIGDRVKITIDRKGEILNKEVILAENPSE